MNLPNGLGVGNARSVRRVKALLVLLLWGCEPDPIIGSTDASVVPGADASEECLEPRELCGSKCTNPRTDSENCGRCGRVCSGGAFCQNGDCTTTCNAGLKACGGSCVDVQSERLHCGDCDRPCPSGRECRGGSCVCPAELQECEGVCVDVDTDETNCGICTRTCRADQECTLGSCKCIGGLEECTGTCVDTQREHDRCGRCDRVCDADQICQAGDCVCAGGSMESNCENGSDDDCDDLIDCNDPDCVGASRGCTGACGPGIERCGSNHQWGACEGGSGEPEICGDGIDQDCNGSDLRSPDAYEPNDDCASCRLVSPTVDPAVTARPSFDSRRDRKDCFCFDVDDSSSPFPENINIDLTAIPAGHDYDLFLYSSVATCQAGTPVASSENTNNVNDAIDWGERFGTDDSGRWVVCVTNPFERFQCGSSYSLAIDGLR